MIVTGNLLQNGVLVGTDRGEFNTPGGIAGIGLASASSGGLYVDSSSVVVYVADKENDNVQVFARTPTTISHNYDFANTVVITFVILVELCDYF